MGAARLHVITCEDGDDLRNTPQNQKQLAVARGVLQEALIQLCQRGYHGKVALYVTSKDGTIQSVETEVKQLHRPKG